MPRGPSLGAARIPKLQFGVELEFLVDPRLDSVEVGAQPHEGMLPSPERSRYVIIGRGLQGAGLPAACPGYGLDNPTTIELYLIEPGSVDEGSSRGSARRFKYWYVLQDLDASRYDQHDPHRYQFSGWKSIEINSPVLAHAEWRDGYRTIQQAPRAIHTLVPVHLNGKCGLHVHVSPASGKLDLVTALRVLTMGCVLEDSLMLPICGQARTRRCLGLARAYGEMLRDTEQEPSSALAPTGCMVANLPLSLISDGATAGLEDLGLILGSMWRAETLTDLWCAIGSLGWTGLRIGRHPSSDPAQKTYTMEFRYGQASLRGSLVARWLDVMLGLFQIAQMSEDKFKSAIGRLHEVTVGARGQDQPSHMSCIGVLVVLKEILRENGHWVDIDMQYWADPVVMYHDQRLPRELDIDEFGYAERD